MPIFFRIISLTEEIKWLQIIFHYVYKIFLFQVSSSVTVSGEMVKSKNFNSSCGHTGGINAQIHTVYAYIKEKD